MSSCLGEAALRVSDILKPCEATPLSDETLVGVVILCLGVARVGGVACLLLLVADFSGLVPISLS